MQVKGEDACELIAQFGGGYLELTQQNLQP